MAEVDLIYDRLGSRVRAVGPMTVTYDRLGNRAKQVLVPGEEAALVGDDLVALFFVLQQAERDAEG
jgi:hypothetical protein